MSDLPKFKTFRDLRSLPAAPAKEIPTSSTSDTSSPSISSNTSITSTSKKVRREVVALDEVSPVRDFQKVPNSVTREFMPQGIFRGKSKQVWDYLWSVSRGAINPTRLVRKSRKEIKEGSGLGSMVTVDAAIEHLIQFNLLKVVRSVGSLRGNGYEIFTPEEVGNSSTSISSISSSTSPIQNLVELVLPESSNTSITQIEENKAVYVNAKTSLKTNTSDDEGGALAKFAAKLEAASKKYTGKGLSIREADKWESLAELLVLELEAAASRTNSVSSVPAFLTEILRRQFFAAKGQQPPFIKSSKTKSNTVGKSEVGEYEIKLLNAEERQSALAQLKEFAGESFLEDFKKWYTEEDWQWLMRELNKG